MQIYVAQLNPKIGALAQNTDKIINALQRARLEKADIVVFPEAAICGYPPEDLLLYESFIDQMEKELNRIIEETKDLFVVVGIIRKDPEKKKHLYNSAAVIHDKKLLGFKDKTLLPTYDVFSEQRYFQPGKAEKVFKYKDKKIGVFICEDSWAHETELFEKYNQDPVRELKKLKPDLVINISASPYYYKKQDLRINIYSKVALSLKCPYIICNQVGANDQLVFDGFSMYFDAQGKLVSMAQGFIEDRFLINLKQEMPGYSYKANEIKDLYLALVLGVKDYFRKSNFSKACIGLSGGIDSAVVACIAVDALGPHNVLGLNMPSRYSSLSSMEDSQKLALNLRIDMLDIAVDHLYQEYLNLLSPFFAGKSFDTTEENLQARIRGMILMAISNKLNNIVLSTGNKSEMAMGYVTLYGDMCGGLGVLNDVSKTLVYKLASYINRKKIIIPQSIIKKEPSAELRENQKDTDSLPEYLIIDQVLEGYVEDHLSINEIAEKYKIEKSLIESLVKRIHKAEYKRRQGPPGIIVTKKAFTKGRYFPIVHTWSED